ncbi:hypothetical protein Tco_1455939 [Tanacetum coccineum]
MEKVLIGPVTSEDEQENYAFMACNSSDTEALYLSLKKVEAQLVAHQTRSNLGMEQDSQMSARDKAGLGYGSLHDRIYIPSGLDKEIDDSQFTYGPKQSKPSESDARSSDFNSCESNCSEETHESMPEPVVNESNVVSQPKVWSDAPIIEEYESDSEDEHVSLPTKEQEIPSFAIKHVKTPRQTVIEQNTCSQSPKPDKKNCSGLMSKKLGLGYGFTTKACFVCGSLSHLIRDCDFHEKRMDEQVELNKQKGKGNVQREDKPVWNNVQRMNHQNQFVPKAVLTRTGKILVNTARTSKLFRIKDLLIVDVQAHDGKKAYLVNIKDFYGGPCYFGEDKEDKVLFTDFECLLVVLSSEFRYLMQIKFLLDIPKQKNMYSFKFKENDPSGGLAFLIAKATTDESNNGIGGKEHKASCKAKSVSSISQPLHLLHMDLFGPTSKKANIHAGLQEANQNAGTEDIIDAGNSKTEAESAQDYFVLPIWSSYSSTVKRSTAKNAGEAPTKHPDLKTDEKPVDKEDQVFLDELERLKRQEKDVNDAVEALRKEFAQETKDLLFQAGAAKASSTDIVNTAITPVSITSPYGRLSFTDLTNTDQDDSKIHALEEIYDNPTDGIFTNSSYDDEGAVADFINLEPVVNVSPIPTSRINSIHPSTLILGDPQSAVQTRSKVTKSSGAHVFVSYIQKQRRNNHKDFQHCLFACFLSQHEPKKISESLEDESWVDALQEELLQFKIQKVWILVDLPYGKKAIGTKWGHRQEEGIDYDEVFALVARIESHWIFLAFLLPWGSSSIKMVCKSAFLYGKRIGGTMCSQPPGFLGPKRFLVCDEFEALMKSRMSFVSEFYGRAQLLSWITSQTERSEAEYVAAANCCGQVLWIQNQMLDYGFNFMNTKIYIDNESTICIVKNPVFHSKTKHIAIRHHFIRDAYEKKLIQVLKIHTDDNVVDLLTKAFDLSKF